MLDKLKAADFRKFVGQKGRAVILEGPDAEFTIIEVTENKKGANPDAPKGTRIPFTVVVRTDERCMLCSGRQRDIVLPDGTVLEQVFISEITSHPNPESKLSAEEELTEETRTFTMCFG